MKIKVCGMNAPDILLDVAGLGVDMLGFIFYSPSPRSLDEERMTASIARLPSMVKKVGVFVDMSVPAICEKIHSLQLDYCQLHGPYTLDEVKALYERGISLIKVFHIGNEHFDWKEVKAFEPYCTYFLFDTKTKLYGGSGQQFNWQFLKEYTGGKPFFLSGGIGPEDAEKIKDLNLNCLLGLDLNSRFERAPGIKNTGLLANFLKTIKNDESYKISG